MSSKTSSFKIWVAMARKPWALALSFIAFFFALPVNAALSLQNYANWKNMLAGTAEVEKVLAHLYTSLNIAVVVVISIGALVMALSFFSYLNNKRQIDFYHSLPVKRGKLFVVHSAAALLSLLLPYLINLGLSVVVVYAFGAGELLQAQVLVGGFLTHTLFAVAIFAVAVLAVGLSGGTVVATLLSLFLLGVVPSWSQMLLHLMEIFYPTYYIVLYDWETIMIWGSPLTRYIAQITATQPLSLFDGGIIAGATGIIFLLALIIHLKRPSEAAGHAIAFPRLQGVVKYVVAAWGACGFGLFFYSLGDAGTVDTGRRWLVFGVVVGTVLMGQIGEIIFNADFRAIKKHWGGTGILMAVLLVLVFAAAKDVTHFNDYLPQAADVAQINIRFTDVNPYVYDEYLIRNGDYDDADVRTMMRTESQELEQGPIVDQAGIEAALSVVSKLMTAAKVAPVAVEPIAAAAENDGIEGGKVDEAGIIPAKHDNRKTTGCHIVYTLTDGSRVARQYDFPKLPVSELSAELDAIYSNSLFRDAQYALFEYDHSRIRLGQAISFVGANNFHDPYASSPAVAIGDQRLNQLLLVYERELKQLTPEYFRQYLPVGILDFYIFMEAPGNKTAKELEKQNYIRFTYPIYASFSNTIAALAEMGFDDFQWQDQQNNISQLVVATYDEEWNSTTQIYTDPVDIAQIMAETVNNEASYYNSFMDVDDMREVTVIYRDYSRGYSTRVYKDVR